MNINDNTRNNEWLNMNINNRYNQWLRIKEIVEDQEWSIECVEHLEYSDKSIFEPFEWLRIDCDVIINFLWLRINLRIVLV